MFVLYGYDRMELYFVSGKEPKYPKKDLLVDLRERQTTEYKKKRKIDKQQESKRVLVQALLFASQLSSSFAFYYFGMEEVAAQCFILFHYYRLRMMEVAKVTIASEGLLRHAKSLFVVLVIFSQALKFQKTA